MGWRQLWQGPCTHKPAHNRRPVSRPGESDKLLCRLKQLEAPTLVVWGKRDKVRPLSHGKRLARDLPSAQLRVIDKAGHAPAEERPTEVNPLLVEFLRGAKQRR